MNKRILRLPLLAAVVLSAAAPVGYSAELGLHESTLQCQDGTCCPEAGSTCVIGEYTRPDKYYKLSGRCQTSQT